jgi:hypothetical protein
MNWDSLGTGTLCVKHSNHHLHVGTALPKTNKGLTTFAPDQYKAGWCVENQPCYIIVAHGVEPSNGDANNMND